MKNIKIFFIAMICLGFFMSNINFAQSVVSWNFGTTSENPAPSTGTPVTNLSISDISRGNNNGTTTLLTTTSASSGYTGASGQYNAGAAARTGALNIGTDGSAYFEFTLTPLSGADVTLQSISFGTRSTSTAPQAYTIRYSVDSYASDLATGSISNNSTWSLKTNSDINASSVSGNPVTFRIYGYNGTGSPATGTANWRIDDLELTLIVTTVSGPALQVSPTSLSGFIYSGSGPSASQSYNMSGSDLTPSSGNISITGSANYEVSSDNSLFGGSLNIPYSSGTLNSTTVYVRLKAGLTPGIYNGELISNSGGGASSINVICNGAVVLPEPSNHVSVFSGSLGNPAYYFINLNWSDATGGTEPDGYLIKRSDVDFSDILDPVNGVPETNSFARQNVLQGVQQAVFTGFAATTYYFKIYPYTNSGSFIDYKTDGSVPQFSITTSGAPGLPLTENFNYATGSNLTSNGWVAHSSAGNLPIQVNATPLTYTGYINSGSGKSALLTAPGSASAEDVNRLFSSVTSNSLYASFMVNVSSATTDSVYFFHLGPENSTTAFFGKVFVRNNGSDNISFGVAKNQNSAVVFSPFSYSLNTTYLIVLKYTFNTGSTTDDEVKLWINPVLDGTEPTSDITQTDDSTDPLKLDFFALRQANNGPGLTIGGIRISTSWVPVIPTTFSSAFSVNSGWNLVSFPGFHPNSMSPDTLFRGRDVSASLFKFNGTYQSVTTVTPAEGYWLKMSSNRAYNWNGTVQGGILYPQLQFATVQTVDASAGWNLIGVYEYPFAPSDVTTNPPGLITEPIFEYNPGIGYSIANVLERGKAFWVFMDAAGTIILPPRGTVLEKSDNNNFIEKNWSKINITDADGFSADLYASNKVPANGYKLLLPPQPPVGASDIRYSSNKLVEDLSSEKIVELSSLSFPITIKVEGIDLVLTGSSESGLVSNTVLRSGTELVINNNINKLSVLSTGLVPDNYSLEQNFPNPFNPSTIIRFNLPQEEIVTLKVYNMIGQEISTLLNEKLQAGKHEINFNAAGLSSGVYVYKISAGDFIQSKKMTLIK